MENAIKKAEKGRKLALTQGGIDRINEICRRINEERKNKDDVVIPQVAIEKNELRSAGL